MQFSEIQNIVKNGVFDKSTGEQISIDIDRIEIGCGVFDDVLDILKSTFASDIKYLVVSDQNTQIAAAKNIQKKLGDNAKAHIFDNGVKADIKNVEILQKESKDFDAIIAVGSGTINDLCKYASFKENKPYVVCATVASMNGYSSANASISVDGYKGTLSAQLPKVIIADLDVIANAPNILNISGFGDSICRTTAHADWLLSNKLLGTKYSNLPFDLLKPYEKVLFEKAHLIKDGDVDSVGALVATLIMSGLGMYICGGSYPASQAEHMIAHVMEIMHGTSLKESYHGEQIAVTTLTMARIQHEILKKDDLQFSFLPLDEKLIKSYYGDKIGASCIERYKKKKEQIDVDDINKYLAKNWQSLRGEILEDYIEPEKIEDLLKRAGAPISLGDIQWSEDYYTDAVKFASFMRDRFTFLDVWMSFSE